MFTLPNDSVPNAAVHATGILVRSALGCRQGEALERRDMCACAGPTDFTTSLPFARTPRGRIAVDEHLRVLTHPHSEVGPAHPSEVRAPLHTCAARNTSRVQQGLSLGASYVCISGDAR